MNDWTAEASQMVDRLRAREVITLPETERAFRAVPRHLFLPASEAHRAYTYGAIPTKMQNGTPISSSSDPAVMAVMIEQLRPQPGDNVLEIGAGTGYNAAVLSEIVGEGGHVVSVDIDDDICATAQDTLDRAGYSHVQIACKDGAYGVPEGAPYDRIIATVGIYEISRHWFGQLKPGGFLVAPLWVRGSQCLVAFEKTDGALESRSVKWGGFMRMRGSLAGPESYVTLKDGWSVATERPSALIVPEIEHLLEQEPDEHPLLAERVGPSMLGFSLFVASQDPRVIVLTNTDDAGQLSDYAVGLLDADSSSMCLAISEVNDERNQRDMHVRSYGDDAMLGAMTDYLEQWSSLGRPSIDRLQVTATLLPELDRSEDTALAPGALVRGSFAMRFSWLDTTLEE